VLGALWDHGQNTATLTAIFGDIPKHCTFQDGKKLAGFLAEKNMRPHHQFYRPFYHPG
jgi:hypothetical protein